MIEQENVALRMRIAAKEATIKDKDRHVDEVRRALSASFLPHVWSVYDAERAPLNRPRFLSFHLLQLLSQVSRLEIEVKDRDAEREKLAQEGTREREKVEQEHWDSLAAMESEVQAERAQRCVTCKNVVG
jgi:hypothetical protein